MDAIRGRQLILTPERWRRGKALAGLLLPLWLLFAGPGVSAARRPILLAHSSTPVVTLDQFPPEERAAIEHMLALIEAGGPFPYRHDGIVFSNREHRLPKRPIGYYREFTVPTPGLANRGARRLVVGAQGEIYYTNDHYRSFYRLR
jgi:guanyl-specific ribonuclease Sa